MVFRLPKTGDDSGERGMAIGVFAGGVSADQND